MARKVLLTMSRREIPVTPENYRLWYEYVLGRNEDLCREIDAYLKQGARFSEELNRELYDRYFGEEKKEEFIKHLTQATSRILKEALESILATGDLTQDYSHRLNDFVTRLETEPPEPEALKQMIQALILDTRRVEQSSTEISRQLERAQQEANELRRRLEKAEREATRDVLTGLYNRKYLDKALEALARNYAEEGIPFSVIMLDIDHFKRINDTYGHKVGDSVLEFIGQTINGSVKGRDVPTRYGGEEFVIVLPATVFEDACKVAESLRRQISSKILKVTKTQKKIGTVTVSAGVAQIRPGDSVGDLLERVDRALYLAKQEGRNRVMTERDLADDGKQAAPAKAGR